MYLHHVPMFSWIDCYDSSARNLRSSNEDFRPVAKRQGRAGFQMSTEGDGHA